MVKGRLGRNPKQGSGGRNRSRGRGEWFYFLLAGSLWFAQPAFFYSLEPSVQEWCHLEMGGLPSTSQENAPWTSVCRQVDGGIVSTEVLFPSSSIRTERDAEKRGTECATCQKCGMAGHFICCTSES